MLKVHIAEIRNAWSTWLGVILTFIAVNFAMSLSALALYSGQRFLDANPDISASAGAYVLVPGTNLISCAIVGAAVIGSSTSLVIDARRGALARLGLGGATPAQISTTVLGQLAIVSLASAVVGAAFALLMLQPAMNFMAFERSEQEDLAAASAVYAPLPVLLATGFSVAVALVGGLRQAIRGSRIAPVEALRQAQSDGERHMGAGRWILAAFAMLGIVGTFVGSRSVAKGFDGLTSHLQVALALLFITGILLSALAPVIVGPVTRAWTAVLPRRWAAWRLARSNSIERSARLAKSVVPILLMVGLLVGTLAVGSTFERSMVASGQILRMTAVGWASMFNLLALPLLIPLTGAIGSLMMMSRQRDAESALLGVAGATIDQRVRLSMLEGVILTVTGTILGAVMVVASVVYLMVGISSGGFTAAPPASWGTFAAAVGVSLVVLVSATTVPTLPALRRPEHVVVAKLVAD